MAQPPSRGAGDGASVQSDERLQSDLEEAGLRAMIVHDAGDAPDERAARAIGGVIPRVRTYFDVANARTTFV